MDVTPNADGPVGHRSSGLHGLRANSFGMLVMLLIELGLGMWVNLYVEPPKSDHGANLASGFGRAVGNGPAAIAVHALLGVLLLAGGIAALARAVLIRRAWLIATAAVGLAALLSASASGSSFIGDGKDAASMSMAISACVAILAYAAILFRAPGSGRLGR